MGNAFYVFKNDGAYIKFTCRKNGLYTLDVNNGSDPIILLTVQDQMKQFLEIDVKKATLARYIQERLCLLFDMNLSNGLESGGIQEWGVDQRHVKIANEVYGPSKHALQQGNKTVQQGNNVRRDSSYIGITRNILDITRKCHWGLMICLSIKFYTYLQYQSTSSSSNTNAYGTKVTICTLIASKK